MSKKSLVFSVIFHLPFGTMITICSYRVGDIVVWYTIKGWNKS